MFAGPINVALGKPTTQSSKLGNGIPSHAVDGNRNQTYSEGSCSHTLNSGPESWWMVDLLNIYNIDSIMIFNRIDCCCKWSVLCYFICFVIIPQQLQIQTIFFTDMADLCKPS